MSFIIILLFTIFNLISLKTEAFQESFWQQDLFVRKLEKVPENKIFFERQKINLNSADKKMLQSLSGIGPKKADAIIQYRMNHGKYKDFNDLSHIKGFNKKFIAKLIEKNLDVLTIKE